MTPLTLSTTPRDVPENFPGLLDLLAARPQPALVWYGAARERTTDPERVELSGRVLQNWAVKMIGLFREELDEPLSGSHHLVVLDAAPHWKAAAAGLAAGALGAEVHVLGRGSAAEHSGSASETSARAAIGALSEAPDLVVTDRPRSWAEGALADALGDAELAALSPGLLDPSFEAGAGESIPAWVLDVSAEVRQHPDQLLDPLDAVSLPSPGDPVPGAVVVPSGSQRPPLHAWRALSWRGDAAEQVLGVWAHSGTVVLFDADPAEAPESWNAMLRNESPS